MDQRLVRMHVKRRPCAFLILDFQERHVFAYEQGLCLKITESRLPLDRFDVNGAGLGAMRDIRTSLVGHGKLLKNENGMRHPHPNLPASMG